MKFKILFDADEDNEAWETEPVDFEDLLYGEDIEFRNVDDTISLPLDDFRFYYSKNGGNHKIIIIDNKE